MSAARPCPSSPSQRASAAIASAWRRGGRGVVLDDDVRLTEVVHAERRRVARGAAGRQHVVRAGEVVARGLAATYAPTKIAPAVVQRAATSRASATLQLEVLGRERVRELDRLVERRRRPRAAPWCASACSAIARRGRSRAGATSSPSTAAASGGRRRHEHRARLAVVLGLREQVGGDPRRRRRVVVGDDEHLATGRRSSRCRPRRTPGASPTRPTRCRGRRSCRRAARVARAVRERGDRLRAAELEHAVDAGELAPRAAPRATRPA